MITAINTVALWMLPHGQHLRGDPMYIHTINPVLFSIGPLEVRYYGLIYALGFLLAFGYLRLLRHRGLLALHHDDIETLLLYLMMGIVIGARLFHILFWEPAYYFSNPAKILAVWEGGLSFHGGLAGTIIALYFFSRRKKIPLLRLMDSLTVPAALALSLGRVANFINGELWGKAADPRTVSWCVNFKNTGGGDICRHPYQLYEALERFALFAVLLTMSLRRFTDGFLAWTFILLFGIGRFIVDFWREDILFLGLAPGQWLSLLMIIIGTWMLWRNHRRDIAHLFTKKATAST